MATSPLRLGLTGGIGSGKSTVASMLAGCGAGVIDADAISRGTTAVGGSAIEHIRKEFGESFVTPEGAMDRERMRQKVFVDPKAKAKLESIVHPLVGLEIARQAEMLTGAGKRCLVFDIPLLVESGHWRKALQRVLVVDCSPATQISRVIARNGLSAEQVQKIIAAQVDRKQRLNAADLVLCNEGVSLATLEALAQRIGQQFGL